MSSRLLSCQSWKNFRTSGPFGGLHSRSPRGFRAYEWARQACWDYIEFETYRPGEDWCSEESTYELVTGILKAFAQGKGQSIEKWYLDMRGSDEANHRALGRRLAYLIHQMTGLEPVVRNIRGKHVIFPQC